MNTTTATELDSRDMAVQTIVRAMADYVNSGSSAELGRIMLADLTRQHRTLQQGVMSALKCLIEGYSALDQTWVDARNEAAHEWAHTVEDLCKSPSRTLPGRLPFL